MTKEEKDIIFNQLLEFEERHPAFAENVRDNAYCEAVADVKRIIERINETSIPSNLDEAAEKSAEKVCGVLLADRFPFIQGFKSGAEWMAGQGVTKDGLVAAYDNGCLRVYTTILDKEDGIKFGDRVVVQIRKK